MAEKAPSKVVNSKRKPPNAGSGRVKGVPNKVTHGAKIAFGKLVDGNVHNLQKWLDRVADGVPVIITEESEYTDEDGILHKVKTRRVATRQDGSPIWIVQPAPDKALDILQKLAEYYIPKLARTEVVGDEKKPLITICKWQDAA